MLEWITAGAERGQKGDEKMIAIYDMPIGHIPKNKNGRKHIYDDESLALAVAERDYLNTKFKTNDYEVRKIEVRDIGGTDGY